MKKLLSLAMLAGMTVSSLGLANWECLSTTDNLRKEVAQRHTALFRERNYYGHVAYGETWQEASNRARAACAAQHPLAVCTQPSDRDNCSEQ